jgi:hypothetical protein
MLLVLMMLPVSAAGEAAPTRPVTVAQLEEMVAAGRQSDRNLSRLLLGVELTQRLSPERYRRLNEALPGRRSREALLLVADLSGFLDLPAQDVDADAPPDAATQKQILSRAVDYVAAATHRLPDFLATRRMTRFEDLQVLQGVSDPVTVRTLPFRRLDRSAATVVFREGREEGQPGKTQGAAVSFGLTDRGIFGVLLAVVATDVLNGRMGFDHWEAAADAQGVNGAGGQAGDSSKKVSVFRFVVPESRSHYSIDFCCYNGRDGWVRRYEAEPGYHGEMAIDPESGAILRLVLKSDLDPSPMLHVEADAENPLRRADVLVEYGPVAIGGHSYICPLRSISVQTSWTRGDRGPAPPIILVDSGHVRPNLPQATGMVKYSRVTALNHYDFEGHHLFRGDVQMVPDAVEAVPAGPR